MLVSRIRLLASAVALVGFAAGAGGAATPAAQVWKVDPVHSSATFTAVHFGISHVSGTIPILSATVTIPDGGHIPIAAAASLDPSAVDTHNGQRDGDLRSPHFFDVQVDPAMTFASTSVTPVDATHFTIQGNLTMHGQTHPVTLNGVFIGEGKAMRGTRIGFTADGTITRSQWGMGYFVPVASDDIQVHLEVEAVEP